ncbi:hypothetical protein ATANTOWER_023627 [Ataeniobius toweri]|uniref:Uncharacterized protein n=1 Tax=Ataeniobius toweri TaxID=208326 RepID=A0ABU7AHJ8_9TELE|nr:hypothetical protein [Ataeniobius toweri]
MLQRTHAEARCLYSPHARQYAWVGVLCFAWHVGCTDVMVTIIGSRHLYSPHARQLAWVGVLYHCLACGVYRCYSGPMLEPDIFTPHMPGNMPGWAFCALPGMWGVQMLQRTHAGTRYLFSPHAMQ